MTTDDTARDGGGPLAEHLAHSLAEIDRELAEIEMLAAQVKSEAGRHEQRRAAAAEKVAGAMADPSLADLVASYNQLTLLTKRATLMEAQADLLEAKGKALARHRAALVSFGELAAGRGADTDAPAAAQTGANAEAKLPPSLSRVVLSAQEDLRREIARSMHDGPAQSLTNIVLQAQIVDRLMDRNPDGARDELHLLTAMVQHTLDTTKNFIFDVRPMVLDDLGLVPTLRRTARERGRRAHVTVEFESHGQDRRLSMELESVLFRMIDQTLAAYLAQSPDRASLTLEWGPAELQAVVTATRAPVSPPDGELPPIPDGDVPDAIRRMIQDRHDARAAAVAEAEAAARLSLPAVVRRDLSDRAAYVGASAEVEDGGTVRITAPVAEADASRA